MEQPVLTVREIQKDDISRIVDYWQNSPPDYLESMGVDLARVPDAQTLSSMLSEQLTLPYEEKKSYCIIWEAGGRACGHSNINRINFGREAYMHLHIWNIEDRKRGWGQQFIRMTVPWFFKNYRLEKLYSEPYALNDAPHRALMRAGFEFEGEYETVPGSINFFQPVRLWKLTAERSDAITLLKAES